MASYRYPPVYVAAAGADDDNNDDDAQGINYPHH